MVEGGLGKGFRLCVSTGDSPCKGVVASMG